MPRFRDQHLNSHLPPDLILPTDAKIPPLTQYRTLNLQTNPDPKRFIEELWHINDITTILAPIPNRRRSPYEPDVYLIHTSHRTTYEYTCCTTTSLDPGTHLLREVLPDGERGAWTEGPFLKEMMEKEAKALIDAGWGSGYKPLTEMEHAEIMGAKELRWLGLGGDEKCHAGVLWIMMGKPEVGTEVGRGGFERVLGAHLEEGCGFEERKCRGER
ncbi:hypothetical protein BJ508DRAFT_331966 [Ascobolus immersus RN42]|uniref:Uncharacterized protein n=1 Tax=Ascobolus immersus RN42 TaxID=1160509 RepID=A0A3N4HQG4_ASCIM|nr:hypothetical protein BJ508DRAFT_331966 [Ascobolus immersus RN42]